ncbi:tetratricopeptide repeat protein [Salidesulfovibrio onnuriiensis]|uniref:tetratricopeptide repeat protein n=1 Tax=Salidesulfovibrio onnuriiensis TaxID=2583823 RepID=UPI0011CAF3BC|nr:tetratricopeptide repeat protein [Salidesulfovibrio onnuriiensis]
MPEESKEYEVMGVYSHSPKYQYQFGERTSRYRHGTYWFVRRINERNYEVQPLNAHNIPSGVRKVVDRETFLKYYTPELEYYRNNMIPCLESLHKKVRMGRRYFNLGRLDEAERSFCEAIIMHDENVDANMGLGGVYAEQREFSKLRQLIDKLVTIDEVFREEQRHKFNAFGIDLRKRELYDDAIRFYRKALEVNNRDEHLHFNIARAYHGKEDLEMAGQHLKLALRINPRLREAEAFLVSIRRELRNQQSDRDKEREWNRQNKKPGSISLD